MGFIEIFLSGVGLSMDAFAVAICKGLNMKKFRFFHAVIVGLFFGVFQALMPLLGWLVGTRFEAFITPIDHWIAFLLLSFIGGKMLYEAFHPEKDEGCPCEKQQDRLDLKELLLMAIATSIDALAVGIMFSFLEVQILFAILVIGCTTFLLSIAGVWMGHQFGARFEKKAQILGGLILVGIGVKILVEHLFI